MIFRLQERSACLFSEVFVHPLSGSECLWAEVGGISPELFFWWFNRLLVANVDRRALILTSTFWGSTLIWS